MDHPSTEPQQQQHPLYSVPRTMLNRQATVIRLDGGGGNTGGNGGRKSNTSVRKISCNMPCRKISIVMGPRRDAFSSQKSSPNALIIDNRDGADERTTTTELNILDDTDDGDDDNAKSMEYSVDALGNYLPQIRPSFNIIGEKEEEEATKDGISRPGWMNRVRAKMSLSTSTNDSSYFPNNTSIKRQITSQIAAENSSEPLEEERSRFAYSRTENLTTLSSGVALETKTFSTAQLQQPKTSKVLFAPGSFELESDEERDNEFAQRPHPSTLLKVPGAGQSVSTGVPSAQKNAARVRSISYAFQYGTDWQTTADEDEDDEEGDQKRTRKTTKLFARLGRFFFSPTRPYTSRSKSGKTTRKVSFVTKCDRVGRVVGAAIGGEEWLFLIVLGIIMACLSYTIDMVSDNMLTTRLKLYDKATTIPAKLFIWLSFPLTLVALATALTNKFAPQAIGSGIPEMKTILHGVILKDYLSIPTLITKYFGLMLMLSSGLPIGKVGPFVHIGSMVARQLNRLRAFMVSRRLARRAIEARRRRAGSHGIEHGKQDKIDEDDSTSGVFQTSRSMMVETAGKYETLAAGCASGVAAAMAAPIGGVLFSIEATSIYFAVKNYWRGFFAAVCAALTFLLLGVMMKKQVTILPVFQTKFPIDFPFDPVELLMFAFVGVICGISGALFVKIHRRVVLTQRKYVAKKIIPYFVYAYPLGFCALYFLITFPDGLGHYMAGRLSPRKAMVAFFSDSDMTEHIKTPQQKLQDSRLLSAVAVANSSAAVARAQLLQQLGTLNGSVAYNSSHTTSTPASRQTVPYLYGGGGDETGFLLSPTLNAAVAAAHYGFEDNEAADDIRHFVADRAPEISIIVIVANYVVFNYFVTPVSITLPVPVGVFAPTFVIGCSVGRLIGEIVAHYFPNGIADPDIAGGVRPILPGAYAVVAAAAFSGAVTQTISTSVIAAEMTGQMAHILPILVATLIANYVARRVGEVSIFDSIIRLKRLPYLPQLDVLSASVHRLKAGDIMMRAVKFVTLCDTYEDVRRVLENAPPSIRVLPLVDASDTMVLVGAIARRDLQECVAQQMNFQRYLAYFDKMQTRQKHRAATAMFDRMLREKQEAEHKKILSDDVEDEFFLPLKRIPSLTPRRKLRKISSAVQLSIPTRKLSVLTEQTKQPKFPLLDKHEEYPIIRIFTAGSTSSNSTPASSSESSSTSSDDENEAAPTQLLIPENEKSKAATTTGSPLPESVAQIQQIWRPSAVDNKEDNLGKKQSSNTTDDESPKSTTVNLLKTQQQEVTEKHDAIFNEQQKKAGKRINSTPIFSEFADGRSNEELNALAPVAVKSTSASGIIKDHVMSRIDWEQHMLELPCNFDHCSVDVSPMQVVENMSISKLHRLFSLLGLQTVYATSLGRLVGVVTVGDLRRALQETGKKP